MCDCIRFTPLAFSVSKFKILGSNSCKFRQYYPSLCCSSLRNGAVKFVGTKTSKNPRMKLEEYECIDEFGFKEKGKDFFEMESQLNKDSTVRNKKATDSPGLDVLQSNDKTRSKTRKGKLERGNLARVEDGDKLDNSRQVNGRAALRIGRQVIRRSNIMAKQVISIRSALSLGFLSQVWVDTRSWTVLVVEVRSHLLSGESERFLLEDVSQVGDVVLVEDENLIEKELKMVGLETLVGYKVVTPGRQHIGKVRGYSFNINSGTVESLELDSFGISIIPSSLVSTYALLVEDVLEVLSDTVVVHEAAASHIQRLTKGFWDGQNARTSDDVLDEYTDSENSNRSHHGRSKPGRFRSQKSGHKIRETVDDWEPPMDYL